MAKIHHFTEEERAELLCNPYTARISECNVTFTLAFKQLVIDNIDLPGMNSRKVFQLAGYNDSLFTPYVRRYVVSAIRREAASDKGLQEPSPLKSSAPRKKHSETEFRELQERVTLLEQQLNFLKKSQQLRKQNRVAQPDNSS